MAVVIAPTNPILRMDQGPSLFHSIISGYYSVMNNATHSQNVLRERERERDMSDQIYIYVRMMYRFLRVSSSRTIVHSTHYFGLSFSI